MDSPQSWNRYSYVNNNPTGFVDPSGHGQCRTKEECEDTGTTPMGGGNSGNSGNSNAGNKGSDDKDKSDHGCNNNPDCELGRGHDDGGTGPICYPGELVCQIVKNGGTGPTIDPRILPDYVTLNVAIPTPLIAIGPDFQISLDHYGQLYVAGGFYAGAPGASVFGGYILQSTRPKPQELQGFMTQDSVFMGGGAGLGGGGTWGKFDQHTLNSFAAEAGWTSPGAVGGWTYGVSLKSIVNSVVNLFTGNP